MGVIISCLGIAGSSTKNSRDKKSSNNGPTPNGHQQAQSQSQPQSFSPQPQEQQQGRLGDEQLAATTAPGETGTTTENTIAAESQDLSKNVGVGAPVPFHTAHTNSNPNQSTNGNQSEKMASDEDYAAFLDKANRDPNEGVVKSQSNGEIELKAVDKGQTIPECLTKATKDSVYVSDADEPFVPVCLKHGGDGLPDEETFAKLVNHPSPEEAEVEIIDIGQWDKQGQYNDVVNATREASKGSDVMVYRISKGGSRAEYWLVGTEGGRIVGVKALAIES